MTILFKDIPKYESRYPLNQYKIVFWAQEKPNSNHYQAHILVWAECKAEALLRCNIWKDLIIKIELNNNQN